MAKATVQYEKIKERIQLYHQKLHAEQEKKLLFLGYTVLHFWGQDISKHTDECLQAIEEAIWDTKFSDTTTDYDISEE